MVYNLECVFMVVHVKSMPHSVLVNSLVMTVR